MEKKRDEDPELMIGARQFVIPRDDGVENVILVHHPLSWYKDQEQVRQYVRSRARVFISGHEHDPKVSVDSVDQGCDVLMLAAGATVPYHSDDIYTFTYNIIEFDWDEEIDGLSVTIHPRAWNPQRTCFENDDKRLGGKDPNYRLKSPNFRVAPRPQLALPSSPIQPKITEDENTTLLATGIEKTPTESSNEGTKCMPSISASEGYEIARLRFFRDLF
ncbi:hypothetical protein LNO18_20090 [Klebsiella variicola subsp. variicola]|nr:hypothetical protein [Klebsiella variicola subsp. variicola]